MSILIRFNFTSSPIESLYLNPCISIHSSLQALLLLQRVIRGRAMQNRMFVGKEKRLDLIDELRSAELLLSNPRPEDQEMTKQLQSDVSSRPEDQEMTKQLQRDVSSRPEDAEMKKQRDVSAATQITVERMLDHECNERQLVIEFVPYFFPNSPLRL